MSLAKQIKEYCEVTLLCNDMSDLSRNHKLSIQQEAELESNIDIRNNRWRSLPEEVKEHIIKLVGWKCITQSNYHWFVINILHSLQIHEEDA